MQLFHGPEEFLRGIGAMDFRLRQSGGDIGRELPPKVTRAQPSGWS